MGIRRATIDIFSDRSRDCLRTCLVYDSREPFLLLHRNQLHRVFAWPIGSACPSSSGHRLSRIRLIGNILMFAIRPLSLNIRKVAVGIVEPGASPGSLSDVLRCVGVVRKVAAVSQPSEFSVALTATLLLWTLHLVPNGSKVTADDVNEGVGDIAAVVACTCSNQTL